MVSCLLTQSPTFTDTVWGFLIIQIQAVGNCFGNFLVKFITRAKKEKKKWEMENIWLRQQRNKDSRNCNWTIIENITRLDSNYKHFNAILPWTDKLEWQQPSGLCERSGAEERCEVNSDWEATTWPSRPMDTNKLSFWEKKTDSAETNQHPCLITACSKHDSQPKQNSDFHA